MHSSRSTSRKSYRSKANILLVAVLTSCSGSSDGGTSAGTSSGGSAQGESGAGGSLTGGFAGSTTTGGGALAAGGSGTGGSSEGGSAQGGTGVGGNAGSSSGGGGGAGGSGGSGGQLGKFVGNITTNGAVRDGFVKYWNQITPENEGKWGSVEASKGNRNWTALDKIYKYAQDNNIPYKHHNFVWGSQQPGWISGLSAADQKAAVQDWISAVCQRYPNTKLIDVVNEPPPHTTPPYKDAIGGDGASGYDWIVNVFTWARAACPNAVLILNDYNNIEYGADNSHFIDVVNAIKKAGAPIDAIGAQAHDAYKLPTATVKGFIDKLAATGLPVYITEYDIDLADDAQQKNVMQEQMTMFYGDASIKGITLWGYIVGSTWRTNTGLMQPNNTMRPAMSWLMTFLGR